LDTTASGSQGDTSRRWWERRETGRLRTVDFASGIIELGAPGPMRDDLIASVMRGDKTATSSLLAQYEDEHDPLPEPRSRLALVDSDGEPVGVVEIVSVDVIRLGDADLQLALDEGEGFRSVAEWRVAHEHFWTDKTRPLLNDPLALTIDDDTKVVVERFHLVT
jgi:uncharacterized protein YhfF